MTFSFLSSLALALLLLFLLVAQSSRGEVSQNSMPRGPTRGSLDTVVAGLRLQWNREATVDMPPKFNSKAESYSRFAVVQHELAAWLSQWLEPADETRCLHALELGAGGGLFTRTLTARFEHLTAIDVAPRMVEEGQSLLPEVDWRVGDAWHLQCEPVDRIFSSSLLQWCEEPRRVLQQWRSLARPGARMLHGTYVAPTLPEWESISEFQSPLVWHNQSQWEDYFQQAGWRVLRSEACLRIMEFGSARELLRFFHQTGAFVPRRAPIAKLRRMIVEYDQKFGLQNSRRGVSSSWTFFRIEAVNA